jgi:hypothetical protein
MFCPNCGKQIPDGSKFCPYCGASLEGKAVNSPKSKSSRSIAKIIIPIILIVVILAGGLFAFFKFIKPNIASNTKKETIATLIPYRKGDKWGYCDWNKKIVIPVQYDNAWLFSEGLARVRINGKCGFIDTKGNMIAKAVYDDAFDFSEGLALVKLNNKYGFIDIKGKPVIPTVYETAFPFSDGLSLVYTNGGYGFINKKGEIAIKPEYNLATPFSNGLAEVKVNGKYGVIDTKGNMVVPAIYDSIYTGGPRNLDEVELDPHNRKDERGNWIISPEFPLQFSFPDGLARVEFNGKLGFVNTKGDMVIPAVYDDAWLFSEGLAYAEINDEWEGYIDKKGNKVISLNGVIMKFPFSEGLAAVQLSGDPILKDRYIDTKGNTVIPALYYNPDYFSEGLAAVSLEYNNKFGFIDTKGNMVIPAVYDGACNFYNGIAPVKFNGKWGFIDKKGNMVIPAIYDYIELDTDRGGKYGYERSFVNGLSLVEFNGKYGYIDTKGTQYWED